MSLTGIVTEVKNDFAIVKVIPKPECKGCHACRGFIGGEKKSENREIRAKIEDVIPSVGDEVLLDLNPGEGSLAALLVFGMPIGGFFTGLFLAQWFASLYGWSNDELIQLAFAISGTIVAFVALAIISRCSTLENIRLKIISIKKMPLEKKTRG